jgi:hypothetical protein
LWAAVEFKQILCSNNAPQGGETTQFKIAVNHGNKEMRMDEKFEIHDCSQLSDAELVRILTLDKSRLHRRHAPARQSRGVAKKT